MEQRESSSFRRWQIIKERETAKEERGKVHATSTEMIQKQELYVFVKKIILKHCHTFLIRFRTEWWQKERENE